jgi:hypothetical protein
MGRRDGIHELSVSVFRGAKVSQMLLFSNEKSRKSLFRFPLFQIQNTI